MPVSKAGTDAFALVSYFEKVYKNKYGVKVVVNKHSARWFFETLLQDITPTEGRALIDYYFTTAGSQGHTFEWFQYNYEKLIRAKIEADKDAAAQSLARAESKRRAEEWRKNIGNRTQGS